MKKLLVLLIFLAIFLQINAEIGKIRIMFENDPSTSATIAWVLESGKEPILNYDTKEGLEIDDALSFVIKPTKKWKYKGMKHCFVELNDLEPETIYYFQIIDSEGASEQYWFKTLPANPTELSIIAGGDSRSLPEIRRLANRMVAKLQPDFVIFDGDFTVSATGSQWAIWLDDWQLTISDGRIIPIVAVMGNHEAKNDMKKIFNTPNNSIYSLDFGNLFHLTVLNTETEMGGEQAVWLKDDLKNSTAKWLVTAYHRPIRPHYSKKSEGVAQYKYWAIPFYENRVDFAIEGDTHTCKITYAIRPDKNGDEGFVRDDQNGTIFIGEGTWGAPIRASDDLKSWTMAAEKINQFKWVFISENQTEIRTVLYENVDDVEQVSYENRFEIPDSLNLWKPLGKDVIIVTTLR